MVLKLLLGVILVDRVGDKDWKRYSSKQKQTSTSILEDIWTKQGKYWYQCGWECKKWVVITTLVYFGKWKIWCEQVKWSNLLILYRCRRKILTSYFLDSFQSIGVGTLSIFIHKFLFIYFIFSSHAKDFLGPLSLGIVSLIGAEGDISVFHILMKVLLCLHKIT